LAKHKWKGLCTARERTEISILSLSFDVLLF
jgi:hypothetical protein